MFTVRKASHPLFTCKTFMQIFLLELTCETHNDSLRASACESLGGHYSKNVFLSLVQVSKSVFAVKEILVGGHVFKLSGYHAKKYAKQMFFKSLCVSEGHISQKWFASFSYMQIAAHMSQIWCNSHLKRRTQRLYLCVGLIWANRFQDWSYRLFSSPIHCVICNIW